MSHLSERGGSHNHRPASVKARGSPGLSGALWILSSPSKDTIKGEDGFGSWPPHQPGANSPAAGRLGSQRMQNANANEDFTESIRVAEK